MVETVSRRKIMRACKNRGWMVQPAALAAMHKYLNLLEEDCLEDVLDELDRQTEKNTKIISETLWNNMIQSNEQLVINEPLGEIEITDAFDAPRLVFDSMRKTFRVEEEKWPLLGTAADKIKMMAQRYDLVHQRMVRHEIFRGRNGANPDKAHQQYTLMPIESLLGKQNCEHLPVLVLGILVQIEEGKYYLEDPSGRVMVSFSNAIAVDSFYVTENSILLVEARFQDEILYIDRVGPPFLEHRKKSLQVLRQQVRHHHFLPGDGSVDGQKSFVILSDVHLDQSRVLTLLEGLFDSYSSCTEKSDLPVFCFMGNFTSNSQTALYQGFEELATLVAKFPFLSQNAHFIFIPGPTDTQGLILPQPSISKEIVGLQRLMHSCQIDHVHWASNPCRIRHNGKEIVLFRYDVLSWMMQNQVRMPEVDESSGRVPQSKMMKTIIDQGHLVSVARAPIYWNYDHALRLYPLPDALILGGSSDVEDYEEIYEDCQAIQPGSFSKDGTYAIFSIFSDDDDDIDMVDGDQEVSRRPVEFCRVQETES